MKPEYVAPDAPVPEDRQAEPYTPEMQAAAVALVEAIMAAHPDQAEAMKRGVNIYVLGPDGVDHLFRLVDK